MKSRMFRMLQLFAEETVDHTAEPDAVKDSVNPENTSGDSGEEKKYTDKAQRNAPVDTGTLKRSIGIDISDGGMTATVEPTAEYAPYVELGTRFMEAQPHLKPAFEEQKKQFEKDLQKLVR